ncbi:MAG: ATP-binding protein, partial [Halovenus sp.]
KDRARVFERGYSSDNHGTGLGLAIVARIVDLHGWAINATSSTAGGARFEVSGLDAD